MRPVAQLRLADNFPVLERAAAHPASPAPHGPTGRAVIPLAYAALGTDLGRRVSETGLEFRSPAMKVTES